MKMTQFKHKNSLATWIKYIASPSRTSADTHLTCEIDFMLFLQTEKNGRTKFNLQVFVILFTKNIIKSYLHGKCNLWRIFIVCCAFVSSVFFACVKWDGCCVSCKLFIMNWDTCHVQYLIAMKLASSSTSNPRNPLPDTWTMCVCVPLKIPKLITLLLT